MPRTITIRTARPADLPAAATLLAQSLRFTDRDAVPAWFMRTTDECGGLTLVALTGRGVVGVSYAVLAHDGDGRSLFSCGLAVAPENRGGRLGMALKMEQRRQALGRGYATIRWTADPMNGRALRVYLAHLGAIVTRYRVGLHDGLRSDPGHAQDDLELVWYLRGRPALDAQNVRRVSLPWATNGAADRDRVRREMSAVLNDGFLGSGLEIDREAQQCHVSFTRALT